MSDKKKEKENKPADKPADGVAPRRKGGARLILVMIAAGSLAPFMLPTLVLVGIGLLPTLVALLTDTDPRKHAAMTVGFLNFAGVVPFVIELWMKGQGMATTVQILGQSTSWLVMFGAAAIGHLLLYAVPPMMATLTFARLEARLKTLQEGLGQLRDIWGTDVANNKPMSQVRKQDEA